MIMLMNNAERIAHNESLLDVLEAQTGYATRLSTPQVMAALAAYYKAPEYAFLPQVANGTGSVRSRTCDALAMSLWPSRGLTLTGLEVKTHRNDWLTELRNPAKADAVASYCDYWFLVVGCIDIVKEGELPAPWGLLAPTKAGTKLRVVKPAVQLEPAPLTRSFLAAILRKAQETVIDHDQIEAAARQRGQEEYQRGLKVGTQRSSQDLSHVKQALDNLQDQVKSFETESGIRIHAWRPGNKQSIGQAVKFVLDGGLDKQLADIQSIRQRAQAILDATEKIKNGSES